MRKLIGGLKPGNRGRRAAGKALVVIAVHARRRAWPRPHGRFRKASADVLSDFGLDNVARGSEVRTDVLQGYNHIGRYGSRMSSPT